MNHSHHHHDHNHHDHDHHAMPKTQPAQTTGGPLYPPPAKKTWAEKYTPLILVLGAILVSVATWEFYIDRFVFTEGLQLFMGLFFLTFGFFKTLDWTSFALAYADYDIIAKRSKAYAYFYPIIELGLGASYLLNLYPVQTNIVTAVVMGVSSIGVIKAVFGQRKIQCACLGTVVKLPMTTVTIIEDVGMGLMAVLMLILLVM